MQYIHKNRLLYQKQCQSVPQESSAPRDQAQLWTDSYCKLLLARAAMSVFLMLGFMILLSSQALAQSTLGDAISNVVLSSHDLPVLISAFCYMTGLTLGALGIVKIKEHVDDPRSTPAWEPIKRFLVGGALFALPTVAFAAFNTIVGGTFYSAGTNVGPISIGGTASMGGLSGLGQTNFTGAASGSMGLDSMIVRLMGDIWTPMHMMLGGFTYLAGLIFTVMGITRLLKSSQEGARGPGGIGTIFTFVVAGIFFALDRVMAVFSTSLTGSNIVTNGVTFAGSSQVGLGSVLDPAAINHVSAVISGVLAFMIIIGWISFIRGWMLLRDYADTGGQSQNASLMAALTHIFGGALLVNLGPLMNMVQTTLNLTQYGFFFI